MLTLSTLADRIEEAVSNDDVDVRLANMEKLLKDIRNSIPSLGYAYGYAVDSISFIIHMEKCKRCRDKVLFNEDKLEALRLAYICRSIFNRE